MNPQILNQLEGIDGFDEPGNGVGAMGKFSFGKKLKGLFKKALPIIGKVASVYTGGATGAILGKAISGASKRKKRAKERLDAARTPAERAAAQAEYNAAAQEMAAAQTVNNGLSSGQIPMNATALQAQQIAIAETLRRNGVDPDSEEGLQAGRIVSEAAKDNTMLYVAGGIGAAVLAGALLLRK